MLIYYFMLIPSLLAIWPPPYEVNLKQNEEFIISDPIEMKDIQDVYDEEEMFRNPNPQQDNKYYRLHQAAKRQNSEIDWKSNKKYSEINPIEPQPWIAGYIDKNKQIITNEDTVYFDEDAKRIIDDDNLQKREAKKDYNYDSLKIEYEESIRKAEKQNDTLKYQEIKEEESAKEAIKTLIEFTPRNCTDEEKQSVGINAVKCFWTESKNKHFNKDQKYYLMNRILLIVTIWIIVYLVIALPLWCQYGWCCCCCRCKWCFPRDEIDEVKAFFANNPVGVYHDDEGNLVKYQASVYEQYAQKKLEKAILRL